MPGIKAAADSVKDALLGTTSEVKIGDVLCSVLMELSNPVGVTITRKPIEAAYTVTDAAVEIPQTLRMTICLANAEKSAGAAIGAAIDGDMGSLKATWRDSKNQLYAHFDNRDIIEVQTHEDNYESMLIESIDPIWDVNENSDAFFATVTLVHVNQVATGGGGGLKDQAKEQADA